MPHSRAIFLGQKPIGQDCFRALRAASGDHLEVVAAVSNESPEGRWWRDNAIWRECQEAGLSCLDNSRRRTNSLLELIDSTQANTLISVQHAWILPARVLDRVGGRALNLHLAPLPHYQGWNAGSHAILNGDERFGVTLHWMTDAVDRGDLAFVEEFPLEPSDTARSLYEKSERAGRRAFDALCAALAGGTEVPARPMEGEARYYAREDLNALRGLPAGAGEFEDLERRARAFYFPPHEPAHLLGPAGQKVYLLPSAFQASPS